MAARVPPQSRQPQSRQPQSRQGREPISSARPPRRRRAALFCGALALAVVLLGVLQPRSHGGSGLALAALPSMARDTRAALRAASSAAAVPVVSPAAVSPQGPVTRLPQGAHIPIDGGELIAPSAFLPESRDYDLLIHFHGAAPVVLQAVECVGLNAALAVINLGLGSGVYHKHFAAPGAYERLLAQINTAIAARGGGRPRLGRVALSSYSAGYGAIEAILKSRKSGADLPDAILVADGIYADFDEQAPAGLDPQALETFAGAAQAAAQGRLLFSLSHSSILPPSYAGPQRTASRLLELAGGASSPALEERPLPGYLRAKRCSGLQIYRLKAARHSSIGSFMVHGYEGVEREDHRAQLPQMAGTVLPDLARRWAPPAKP